MQILNDISPYWLCDPTMADARLKELNQAVYGRADMDASLSHADPWSPIPVITDAGLGGEHTRLATLFQLPFPYMPADIACRGLGEPLSDYRMRITLAADLMGLLAADETGTPMFAAVDGAPNTLDEASEYAAAFDGHGESAGLEAMRADMRDRAARVWPDGYPRDEMETLTRQLTVLSARGSAVLSAHHALALHRSGAGDRATGILKRMTEVYAGLFTPDRMTPDGVAAWMSAHVADATGLMDTLERLGLAAEGTAGVVEGVLS